MNLKIPVIVSVIVFASILQSCCLTEKDDYLGSNLYLSEYDQVDRRILYKEKRCDVSGVEIVPMTVVEIAYDTEWIIAKSEDWQNRTNIRYWVINIKPAQEDLIAVQKYTMKFDNLVSFESFKAKHKIGLRLKAIN